MNSGTFTISLDFELLWGIFDKVNADFNPAYFSNTKQLIPKMLDKFAAAEVQVTWATVGMLFASNEEEWRHYAPNFLPSYREKKFSAYEWVRKNGIRPEMHFAPELIQQIIDTPGQELGSHTFAHYYTLIRGQSPEQFRADLKATQRISKDKFGLELESLVFPRNHINELYLGICKEEGYNYVRGNPRNWYWQETQHENLSKKIFRSADCFFNVGAKTTYSLNKVELYDGEPIVIPASRILRPQAPNNFLMNRSRLSRIKTEMSYAAAHQEVYHLWWHPHNFAGNPGGALDELDELLNHFKKLHEEYGMASMNMQTLGTYINQKTLTS